MENIGNILEPILGLIEGKKEREAAAAAAAARERMILTSIIILIVVGITVFYIKNKK
jgi:CHASE3 domain sensor protein